MSASISEREAGLESSGEMERIAKEYIAERLNEVYLKEKPFPWEIYEANAELVDGVWAVVDLVDVEGESDALEWFAGVAREGGDEDMESMSTFASRSGKEDIDVGGYPAEVQSYEEAVKDAKEMIYDKLTDEEIRRICEEA